MYAIFTLGEAHLMMSDMHFHHADDLM